MPVNLLTPHQLKKQIALQAKRRRLEKNLSRNSLEKKSGVPASTIKRFETTGKISLESLLAIAMVLDGLQEFAQLFATSHPVSLQSLSTKPRARGRQ
jgi:transcriptional regulator with XRE-family HTH domain